MVVENVKFTDRIGTETEDIGDKVTVMKLYDRVPNMFQNEFIVKLPYCYYGTSIISGGSSPQAYQQWKVNSIWDPDLSGGAGNYQPMGRDTWAAIYNYYKVLKVKIRVRYYDPTISDTTDNNTRYASLHGGVLNLNAGVPPSENLWLMASHAGASNRQEIFTNVEMVNCNASRDVALHEYHMEWDPTLLESAILDQSAKDTWTPVGSDPDALEYFSQLTHNPNTAVQGSRRIIWITELIYMVSFKQVNANLYDTIN